MDEGILQSASVYCVAPLPQVHNVWRKTAWGIGCFSETLCVLHVPRLFIFRVSGVPERLPVLYPKKPTPACRTISWACTNKHPCHWVQWVGSGGVNGGGGYLCVRRKICALFGQISTVSACCARSKGTGGGWCRDFFRLLHIRHSILQF